MTVIRLHWVANRRYVQWDHFHFVHFCVLANVFPELTGRWGLIRLTGYLKEKWDVFTGEHFDHLSSLYSADQRADYMANAAGMRAKGRFPILKKALDDPQALRTGVKKSIEYAKEQGWPADLEAQRPGPHWPSSPAYQPWREWGGVNGHTILTQGGIEF